MHGPEGGDKGLWQTEMFLWGPRNPGPSALAPRKGGLPGAARKSLHKATKDSPREQWGVALVSWRPRPGELRRRNPGLRASYLDVALVGRPYASLHVHAERPLGLLRRDGAHLGSAVSAGHVASEGAHWKSAGVGGGGTAVRAPLHRGRTRLSNHLPESQEGSRHPVQPAHSGTQAPQSPGTLAPSSSPASWRGPRGEARAGVGGAAAEPQCSPGKPRLAATGV